MDFEYCFKAKFWHPLADNPVSIKFTFRIDSVDMDDVFKIAIEKAREELGVMMADEAWEWMLIKLTYKTMRPAEVTT